MNRWAKGDRGIAALRQHFATPQGRHPPQRYEVVNPRVEIYGDIANLRFRYESRSTDGRLLRWEASTVYRRMAGEWRIVDARWSIVEDCA